MNPVRSSIAVLLMCAALPLAAVTRRHPVATLANVMISGVVRDAATGLPITGAVVHSGTRFCQQGGTKADGVYSLNIPGARPVPGQPDMVNLPLGRVPLNYDTPISADSPQLSLTAKRVGNAWLVVQGGAGLAQRVQVLNALRITKLDLHHLTSRRASH